MERLIRPTPELEGPYRDFATEWGEEEIIPYSARLLNMSYPQWLERTLQLEKEELDGLVSAHTFFLVEGEEIMGAINIRHRLNDHLLQYGGHIGYGVRPSRRGQGYGKKMLAMALPFCRELGLDRVLLCCDKENTASAATILANGGELENEMPEGDGITQRYWIAL